MVLMIMVLSLCVIVAEPARILIIVPTPSVSHQVVFRPLTQELAKRGHEVTYITTDPAFPKGKAPANLTEIDLHDLSYGAWKELFFNSQLTTGGPENTFAQMKLLMPMMIKVFEKQFLSEEVQNVLKQDFDLLILEAWMRSALIYSHIYKNVPVIQVSSIGAQNTNFDAMGAPSRPTLLYPTFFRQRLNNLSLWEKITELYTEYLLEGLWREVIEDDNKMLKKLLGDDTPGIEELLNNVDMLLLNVHPIWDSNRPVPPSIQYIGGIHQKTLQPLPKELQTYLDSSKNGVIYISYGTNVSPASLPPEKIQMLVNAFSQLPYDVLWKWDKDELPGQSKNIKISKWLPQADMLMHPNIKLFITQGGLQSTDEAINAGVPLIGMPMLGDQWFNVEHFLRHKIGLRVDLNTMTEEIFLNAVKTVLNDESFRTNIVRLRGLMRDQPQSALDRAVWWTEYVLRHGGARHLRAPAANMTWAQYLDVELMTVLAIAGLTVFGAVVAALYMVVSFVRKKSAGGKVKRS